MIKTITDINEYQLEPVLETNESSYDTPIILFGKKYLIQDDYWMKHIHLKITDRCNAHCPFCIEKGSNIKENKIRFIESLSSLLKQMSDQGHLATISITGGEPYLCSYLEDVIDIIKGYDCFFTINTNALSLRKHTNAPDWLNISRHSLFDSSCGFNFLSTEKMIEIRKMFPETKFRMQSVLYKDGMTSIESILEFLDFYKPYVDDFSFRKLISTSKNNSHSLIDDFKRYLHAYATLIEQVLKDYYVYETWDLNGAQVTLSHSDMWLLKNIEKTESDNILREIIIHPDGMVSGSWLRNRKTIYV